MSKEIRLTIFKDEKSKEIVRNIAFMKCPYCKEQILLDTDKVTFCKWKCRMKHKVAYKLQRNSKVPEGFDKVLYSRVKNYHKKTLMEEFENGKSILL